MRNENLKINCMVLKKTWIFKVFAVCFVLCPEQHEL